ncbi:hypothetical protein diail_9635 [Diaporthe ilicicola]|nr:hypothetical protein diail_9635 [Diaporthe ilicicola]
MASTPGSSFNSEENSPRVTKGTQAARPSRLPTPQPSDNSSVIDETADEAVETAYQIIWDQFCGLPNTYLHDPTFQLQNQRSYELLYQTLDKQPGLRQYFEEECRQDWNAATGELILRLMALPIHEVFKELLGDLIKQELVRIKEDTPALRPFCQRLVSGGHSKVLKASATSHLPVFVKSPDGQLQYQGERYPTFLFEIAYSQHNQGLLKTVDELFEALPGRIGTVLAVDIDYRERKARKAQGHSHSARISLWTSTLEDDEVTIQCLVDAEDFRNTDGCAVPGEIAIPFELLLPRKERDKLPLSKEAVHLDFASLSALVGVAEERQYMNDKSVSGSPPPQPKRLRWVDAQGTVTRREELPVAKRERIDTDSQAPPSSRTRSRSQPRRSSRIRSVSRGRSKV